MISGWLVKILLGIALVGFLAIELGSPLIARAQADDAAHLVADEVALRGDFQTDETLKAGCAAEAAKHDVTIVACDFDPPTNELRVTITKHARSFLFDRISATKDWYDVEAHAVAVRR